MPLDPQCRALIDAATASGSPFGGNDHHALRAAYANTTNAYQHTSGQLAEVIDTSFPGPASEIPVRVYQPERNGVGPALVFFHGGGWVVGDLDSHDHVCRYLAHGAQTTVISIDYRLAPEHKFPAALDDAVAATRWTFNSAEELAIDPLNIAIGGDSAGGNLAAAAAIALRDGNGPRLALQLLIYPATDCTADDESYRENVQGYLLTRDAMEMFMDFYLPNHAARSDPRASPQLRNSHAGLPRAFILTAEFDPLRDQARRYAETLMQAGCPVEYKCYAGMVHGFARMGGKIDTALTALDDACGVLREALA